MEASIKEFKNILSKNNLYVTDQRLAVFNTLLDLKRPASLQKLGQIVWRKVDTVTLYRTIDTFEDLGIVKKIYTGWKYRIELSETFRPHHHHLTCTSCGKILPLEEDPELENVISKIGQKHSFKITDHEVELRGLCNKCREAS